MGVIEQLSSRVGDRTGASTKRVAERCLAEPALLADIAAHLHDPDAALAGDCAEVMTGVALQQPARVAPYAPLLVPLVWHKKTRIRWEAVHALALVAHVRPDVIAPLMPHLERIVHEDPSIIVRDYAVDAIDNYAGTSKGAARVAYLALQGALYVWQGRHAAHALAGLACAAQVAAELRPAIRADAERFRDHPRSSVRKVARRLLATLDAGAS